MSDNEKVKTYNFSELEKEFGEGFSLKDLRMEKKESGVNGIDYYDNINQINHIAVKPNNDYENMHLQNIRIEALKISSDTAIKIGHFQHKYNSTEGLFEDLDLVHEIADHHLKYILGK